VALLIPKANDAIHVGDADLPWAAMEDGSLFKVVQVRRSEGLWITHSRFRARGSFLYEPANSVHTLTVLEDGTEVWFQIHGALLNLDAEGRVESVADGPSVLEAYVALCEQQGFERPAVLLED
jgi:2,4'-dihydroxyacetophenone dioxygenase